jgi:hypothetical protein
MDLVAKSRVQIVARSRVQLVARSRVQLVVRTAHFEGHYLGGVLHGIDGTDNKAALTLESECTIKSIRAVYRFEGEPAFEEAAADLILRATAPKPRVCMWYRWGDLHRNVHPAIYCDRFWASYNQGQLRGRDYAKFDGPLYYELLHVLDKFLKKISRDRIRAKCEYLKLDHKVTIVYFESPTRQAKSFVLVGGGHEVSEIIRTTVVYRVKRGAITDVVRFW